MQKTSDIKFKIKKQKAKKYVAQLNRIWYKLRYFPLHQKSKQKSKIICKSSVLTSSYDFSKKSVQKRALKICE